MSLDRRIAWGCFASGLVLIVTYRPGEVADTPATSPAFVTPCTEDEIAMIVTPTPADVARWGCVHVDSTAAVRYVP